MTQTLGYKYFKENRYHNVYNHIIIISGQHMINIQVHLSNISQIDDIFLQTIDFS